MGVSRIQTSAYERLCEPEMLSGKERSLFKRRQACLDPSALKNELERRLGKILCPGIQLKNNQAEVAASPGDVQQQGAGPWFSILSISVLAQR